MRELYEELHDLAIIDEGRYIETSPVQENSLDLAEYSVAVDAGDIRQTPAQDIFGNPIYGKPDIGPREFQPFRRMAVDALELSITHRVYSDGQFRRLEASEDAIEVPYAVYPLGDWKGHSALEPRAEYADVRVEMWDEYLLRWSLQIDSADAGICQKIGGRIPGERYQVYHKIDEELLSLGMAVADSTGSIDFLYPSFIGTLHFELMPVQNTVEGAMLPLCSNVQEEEEYINYYY